MPREIPLYPEVPRVPVETCERLDRDTECTRCSFSSKVTNPKSICMAPEEWDVGGISGPVEVLLVSEHPGREEDRGNRPLIGASGRYFRSILKKYCRSTVVLDNAVRCSAGQDLKLQRKNAFKHVDMCRPYLAQTIAEVRPKRIVAMGAWAVYSILGRSLPIQSVRKGYGFMSDGTPVFILINPAAALRNHFVGSAFEEDLKWALTVPIPKRPEIRGIARIVDSPEAAKQAVRELRASPWVAYDWETAGEMYNPDFTAISLAVTAEGEYDAWVWDTDALKSEEMIAPLRDLFTDPNVEKAAHNATYDVKVTKLWLGVWTENSYDTLLARRILVSNADADLETCAELVGMGGHKAEAQGYLTSAIKNARRKKRLWVIPDDQEWCADAIRSGKSAMRYAYGLLQSDVLDRYNSRDTVSTARLKELFDESFESNRKLSNAWLKLTKPLIPVAAEMEHWGIAASRDRIESFHTYLDAQLREIKNRFSALGSDFNPSSPVQVAEVLFKKLKLQPIKYTDKGSVSTDKDVLNAYRGQHAFVDDLLEYRRISKLDSTYALGMLDHIRSDGRIHFTIKICGTETGRVSAVEPNLYNLPRAQTAEGKMARDIFVASPGNVLVELDESQIEIRVAAMLSDDENMRAIFLSGLDYHLKTAELIAPIAWNIAADMVQDYHRSQSKGTTFGLMYGETDSGLAMKLGCTVEQAGRIRAAVLGTFKKFARWIQNQLNFARTNGGVWIPWDDETARWRPLWDIASNDRSDRGYQITAQNSSFNTPIQGHAGFIVSASLPIILAWIHKNRVPAKILLSIYDSIVFDVAPEAVDDVVGYGREVMTSWPSKGVPLVVDAKMGDALGSLKKFESEKLDPNACRVNRRHLKLCR